MVELFRMSKGREFQMIGAATEKLRDPKPVRTRGTNNKLEPEERKYEMGHNVSVLSGDKQAG